MLYPKIISAKVIAEALKLLDETDKHYKNWVENTPKKVALGLAQLYRGEGIEVQTIITGEYKVLPNNDLLLRLKVLLGKAYST
ncbi:MAG: hypothetical protein AAGJ08_29715 [Cyanobacteria bacterium P01_H01_bin.35]